MQWIVASVVVVLFAAGLATAGVLLGKPWLQRRSASKTTPATTTASVHGASSLKVGNSDGLGGGLPSAPAAGGSNGSAGSGATNSSSGTKQAPSPQNFGEYDKYKSEQSALTGDLRVGTGNEASVNKKVAIYYKGWLTNGTLFDESKAEKTGERPKPLVFTIGKHEVVIGMEQGVVGMKGGGQRRIIIPPAVGYGERGYGPVPSNAVMVFDVELVDVE